MNLQRVGKIVMALVVAYGVSMMVAASCVTDVISEAAGVGQISLPLSGVSNVGTTYRFIDGEFVITGTNGAYTISTNDHLGETAVNLALLPGDYTVELLSGWALERQDADGDTPVEGTLISPNPVSITIVEGEVTAVQFQLKVGEELIATGEGTVSIAIDIVEDITSDKCEEPLIECNDVCVNTTTDPSNCGGCGNQCAEIESCILGNCLPVCPAGEKKCNGFCVNTAKDPMNCGYCGVVCGEGERCEQGMCILECAESETNCDGACIDTAKDPMNCGDCGVVCGEGESCEQGMCVQDCAEGETDCYGACVDTATDTMNCGSCAVMCGKGEVCEEGACVQKCAENRFGHGVTELILSEFGRIEKKSISPISS